MSTGDQTVNSGGYDNEVAGWTPGSGSGGGLSEADKQAQMPVFLGFKNTYTTGKVLPLGEDAHAGIRKRGRKTGREANVTTTQEAINKWYTEWTDAQKVAYARKAFALGYSDDPGDLRQAFAAWQFSVTEAATQFSLSGRQVTPDEILTTYMGGSASGKGKLANQSRTVKKRSVDVSSSADVTSMVEQGFRQAVGRDPSDAELRTIIGTIQEQQKANPVTNTTTTKYDANGDPTDVTSYKTGGVDPNVVLNNNLKNDPEAAAYQGATTYYNALLSVLGSGV